MTSTRSLPSSYVTRGLVGEAASSSAIARETTNAASSLMSSSIGHLGRVERSSAGVPLKTVVGNPVSKEIDSDTNRWSLCTTQSASEYGQSLVGGSWTVRQNEEV